MYSLRGENPTKMYYEALQELLSNGDDVAPRGKAIKELRPAAFEYENPLNRVTFLGGRKINPFFQIAESLWILSGRSDVEWLCKFNANMKSFSDDGQFFNAPYGERIRMWNKNDAHDVIINPIDQMVDAYIKLMNDKDTRQAVVVISNPMFDNSKYTIGESGKDIACNLLFTLKIRHDKLHMTVMNRSNDLHWGVMGANLCQFSTIQEVICSWLRNSGKEELKNLEVGTYTQITDSLHVYVDTYGFKCTNDILEYYKNNPVEDTEVNFVCVDEPRMSASQPAFDGFLATFWSVINPYIVDDDYLKSEDVSELLNMIDDMHAGGIIDDYWFFGVQSMIAYRLFKLGNLKEAVDIVCNMYNCQWKISMMYFLKSAIKKFGTEDTSGMYEEMTNVYNNTIKCLCDSLIDSKWRDKLTQYLSLNE